MENIHKKMCLTRKDQKKAKSVCCVAVPGSTILIIAARPLVIGTGLAPDTATAGCVFVSSWNKSRFLFPFNRAKRGDAEAHGIL